MLPSIQLDKRRKKFDEKYMNTCDMYMQYQVTSTQFGLCLLRVLVCLFGFLCVEI